MSKLRITKIVSAVLVSSMVALTLTACGGKAGDIAVTVDNVKIPAGVYLYMRLEAQSQANSKIDAGQTTSGSDSSAASSVASSDTSSTADSSVASDTTNSVAASSVATSSATVSLTQKQYQKKTVLGEPYAQYIKEQTLLLCQRYVYVQEQFDALKLSLTSDEQTTIQSNETTNWTKNSAYFTSNGVGQQSYDAAYENNIKQGKVFNALYTAGGSKAVTDKEYTDYLKQHYILLHVIDYALTTTDSSGNSTGTAVDAATKKVYSDELNKLAAAINSGAENFAKATADFQTFQTAQKAAADAAAAAATSSAATSTAFHPGNLTITPMDNAQTVNTAKVVDLGATASDTSSAATSSAAPAPTPKDASAVIVGDTNTIAASTYFGLLSGGTMGKARVVELPGVALVLEIPLDITADPYYLNDYTNPNSSDGTTIKVAAMEDMKSSEFTTDVNAAAAALKTVQNTSVINYLLSHDTKALVTSSAAAAVS